MLERASEPDAERGMAVLVVIGQGLEGSDTEIVAD